MSIGNNPVAAGVDGSKHALAAVRWAAREAAHRRAPLLLVHAVSLPDLYTGAAPPSDKLVSAMREEGAQQLAAAEAVAKQTADVEVRRLLEDDLPAVVLSNVAKSARMLVLGSAGTGGFVSGLLLGSIAVKMAAHASCPVVVVRGADADSKAERDPVVVGVDGSPLSEQALALAFEEADLRGAPLIAVLAWSDVDTERVFSEARAFFDWGPIEEVERRALAERLAGWGEKYPDVVVERRVVQGNPRGTMLELSKQAQLVVVGSRGRGGFAGLLLGSTSQALIHHADCPVLVVRPASARD